MKRKALLLLAAASLLFAAAPAMAQGTQPPPVLPPGAPAKGPQPPIPMGPDGVPMVGRAVAAPLLADQMSMQDVVPGPSGTTFSWLRRFGITDEPYLADGQHMDSPNGLFVD